MGVGVPTRGRSAKLRFSWAVAPMARARRQVSNSRVFFIVLFLSFKVEVRVPKSCFHNGKRRFEEKPATLPALSSANSNTHTQCLPGMVVLCCKSQFRCLLLHQAENQAHERSQSSSSDLDGLGFGDRLLSPEDS